MPGPTIYLATALILLGLDSLTFLFLPPGSEANPIVSAMPVPMALGLKAAAVSLLIVAAWSLTTTRRYRVRDAMLSIAITAGGIGFGSNLSVLV